MASGNDHLVENLSQVLLSAEDALGLGTDRGSGPEIVLRG